MAAYKISDQPAFLKHIYKGEEKKCHRPLKPKISRIATCQRKVDEAVREGHSDTNNAAIGGNVVSHFQSRARKRQ